MLNYPAQQVKEISFRFSRDPTRWTGEALLALQEVIFHGGGGGGGGGGGCAKGRGRRQGRGGSREEERIEQGSQVR